MNDLKEHIIPYNRTIEQSDRIQRNGYRPKAIWFTGLSGSGKSTLANALEAHFYKRGCHTYLLDGDNIRKGLNNDLDFSNRARKENIRRVSEVTRLFIDAGIMVFIAFVSPFEEDRRQARALIGDDFTEVYVNCPLNTCESRDVKGLYKKARAGVIKNFTGIDSPFEVPENPDIVVNTATYSISQCLNKLIEKIEPQIRL